MVEASASVWHALPAEGGCVLVRGMRGSGKTTTLRAIARHFARTRGPGARILWAGCGLDDAASVVRELLEGLPEGADRTDRVDGLPGVVSGLARRGPVLIVVDDVHLCDRTTAASLAALAHNAERHAYTVVLSADEVATPPICVSGAEVVAPVRLTAEDVRATVRDREVPVPDHVANDLAELCAGNPLVASEFVTRLRDRQLTGQRPLPRRVVLGPQALRAFSEPWCSLPETARFWLQVLALGPGEFEGSARAAAVLGLTLHELAPAEQAGVVRVDELGSVVWPSPLVQRAVAQSTCMAARRSICGALVSTTSEGSAPLHRARWLFEAGADGTTSDAELDAAVTTLVEHGDVIEAYELTSLRAHTTADDEMRCRYTVRAAELSWLAGYSDHAVDLLHATGPPGSSMTEDAATLWQVIHGLRTSWSFCDTPCGAGLAADPAQRIRSLGTAIVAGWDTVAVADLLPLLGELEVLFDDQPQALSDAPRAVAKVACGSGHLDDRELAALRAASWWVNRDDAIRTKTWPPPMLPVYLGDEAAYSRQFADLLGTPHGLAALPTRSLLLLRFATVQAAVGHWGYALATTTASADLAAHMGCPALRSDAMTLASWIAAARGDEPACRDFLAETYQHEARRHAGEAPPMVRWVHAHLALSSGDPAQAYEWLAPLHLVPVHTAHERVVRELSTADFVAAATQAGRPDEAIRRVDDFAAWTGDGAPSWARLDLARCRGMVGGSDAEAAYAEAIDLTVRVGRLPASAHTHLEFGAWLRRNRRRSKARPHLRVAAQYFAHLHAPAWEGKALRELRAAGEALRESPAEAAGLTAQERAIAALAAKGHTNREIAATLSLSPRTVGYHLYKIFPKLGITNRTQLIHALQPHDRIE